MKLYHFTYEDALPAILAEGLRRGDIPITPTDKSLNAPWLTTDNRPQGHGLDVERRYTVVDKSAIRIRVDHAKLDSERLIRWCDFADDVEIERDWRRILERGNKPNSWLIYFGIVRPSAFAQIDVRNAHGYYRPLWGNLNLLRQEVRERLLPLSAVA